MRCQPLPLLLLLCCHSCFANRCNKSAQAENGSAACSVVPFVCMYVFVYICIYVYVYALYIYIYIYIRLYAELCTYDMIDYVLILRASLLQDPFRIDSAGFFTTESISY